MEQSTGAKSEDCVGDYIFNPKSNRCLKRDGVVGRRVLKEASLSGHTKLNRSTTKAKAPWSPSPKTVVNNIAHKRVERVILTLTTSNIIAYGIIQRHSHHSTNQFGKPKTRL